MVNCSFCGDTSIYHKDLQADDWALKWHKKGISTDCLLNRIPDGGSIPMPERNLFSCSKECNYSLDLKYG